MMKIKKIYKLLAAMLFAALFCSCNNSLFDLAIQREEPFADSVTVDVVVEEHTNDGMVLSLRWKKDIGADTYIVMRSEEGLSGYGDFIEVYWGTETGFIDRSIKKDTSYMYRLDKERGSKLFAGKDIVLFDQSLEYPLPGMINAEKMNEGYSISLSWEADEWTEQYVIMKKEINSESGIDFINTDVLKTISGKTNYIDNDINPWKRYAYRLDKKRGDELIVGETITIVDQFQSDPLPGMISIERLNEGKSVSLLWEADEWAEQYVIMKIEVSNASNIEFNDADVLETISGKTYYIDNDVDPWKRYAYRLDKKRGDELIVGESITMLDQYYADPLHGMLFAKSMNDGRSVSLSWETDAWTEQYVIMKKEVTSESGIEFVIADVLVSISGMTHYIDNDIDPWKRYAYRLDKKRGDAIIIGETITMLDQFYDDPLPGIVFAKNMNEGQSVSLSWNADKWADEYVIMKQEITSGSGIIFSDADVLEIITGKTTYIDNDVDPWKRYAYRLDKKRGEEIIVGEDITILEQFYDDPLWGTINLKSFNDGKSVSLSWEADSWTEQYIILKQEVTSGNGIVFTDADVLEMITGKTTYIDNDVDPWKRYAYRLDKKRGSEIIAGESIAMLEQFYPDPKPGTINLKSFNEGESASLLWEADLWTEQYIVLKQEVTSGNGIIFSDADVLTTILGKTTYIDNDVDPWKRYAYRLDKKRGNEIIVGESITMLEQFYPNPKPGTINLKSFNEGESVSLSWEADSWTEQYIILKQEVTSGSGIMFTDADVLEMITGKTTYIDNDVDPWKRYAYRLDKKRGDELIVGESITMLEQFYPDPKPGTIIARSFNEGKSVSLSWEADVWADEYVIMKTEVKDESDIVFTDVLETISGKTTYIDNEIDTQKNYAYRLDKKHEGEPVLEGESVTIFKKTRPDLFPGRIHTNSWLNGKAAYLTWEADAGADEYRIMRALNDENNEGSLEFIQRNGETGFSFQGLTSAVDNGLSDDKSYLYRLDKRRTGDAEWCIGIVSVFSRTRAMPYGEAPLADGFRSDGFIELTWSADEGADKYVLMRRKDDSLFNTIDDVEFQSIWEGTDTAYLDDSVRSSQVGLFEYRLRKIRNNEEYDWPYMTTRAVAAGVEEDQYEPNDTNQTATLIDGLCEGANLYLYGYSDDEVIADTDWYQVLIPARQTAYIRVIYKKGTAHDGYFELHQFGQSAEAVTHGTSFLIRNTGAAQELITFSIQPKHDMFLMDGAKGGMVDYSIEWVSSSNN
jgi:hypothetical protein